MRRHAAGSEDNVYRAIKMRLYPTEEQSSLLAKTFGCVRKVYNMGIEMQKGLYEAGYKAMTAKDLNNYCNRVWKHEFPFLTEVDKFALTNSLFHLDRAYKSFFQDTGYPRMKSRKDIRQSYTTNFSNNNIVVRYPKHGSKGCIKLPKLGWVEICTHRQPPAGAVLKSATISVSITGKYYASLLYVVGRKSDIVMVSPSLEQTLGLDYSSPHFYVDSNGKYADAPHWLREAEAKLAQEQRRLSHMIKGSNNYQKQRTIVAKLHEKASNQRKDFCHQLSRKITNSYNVVCVEDLDLKALSQSLYLGKATMDNGFGMFRTFLQYKLEEQGKYFVKIDRWYPSSKTCSHCGYINDALQLGERTWLCPCCGRTIDRDYNAAINIKRVGFNMLMVQLVA